MDSENETRLRGANNFIAVGCGPARSSSERSTGWQEPCPCRFGGIVACTHSESTATPRARAPPRRARSSAAAPRCFARQLLAVSILVPLCALPLRVGAAEGGADSRAAAEAAASMLAADHQMDRNTRWLRHPFGLGVFPLSPERAAAKKVKDEEVASVRQAAERQKAAVKMEWDAAVAANLERKKEEGDARGGSAGSVDRERSLETFFQRASEALKPGALRGGRLALWETKPLRGRACGKCAASGHNVCREECLADGDSRKQGGHTGSLRAGLVFGFNVRLALARRRRSIPVSIDSHSPPSDRE